MSHAEQGKIFSKVMLGTSCALAVTAIGSWATGVEWGDIKVVVALSLAAGTLTCALVGFLQTRFAEEAQEKAERQTRLDMASRQNDMLGVPRKSKDSS
jgi:hypothetical protein